MPTDPRRLDPAVVARELRGSADVLRDRGFSDRAEQYEDAAALIEHQAAEIARLRAQLDGLVMPHDFPPQPLMHPNAEWCERYAAWHHKFVRQFLRGPDIEAERDALKAEVAAAETRHEALNAEVDRQERAIADLERRLDWRNILETAFRNAPYVQDYVGQHPDPEVGKRVAKVFANRYAELRTQQLRPNAILTSLYEGITGIGSVPPERQVAAQALLAYLFEACDIFEDHPSKVIA